MISSEKKGVSLVEASSWERPFLQEDLAGQNKDSSTIDPDLLPMMNKKQAVEQQKIGNKQMALGQDLLSKTLTSRQILLCKTLISWQTFL